MEWAEKILVEEETFDDVIFTDEAIQQYYRRIRVLKSRPKHPTKLHVWGSIATSLVLFKSNMTATQYTKILDTALVPLISTTYSDHH